MTIDTSAATTCHGYAALDAASPLRPYSFTRRALRPDDVRIEIQFCGVCHTDLHQVRNDWRSAIYPCVPGHEIVGQVTAVGSGVRKHTVGDLVAVGCFVDSCQHCTECREGREQYCRLGVTATYNSKDRSTDEPTMGGYSTHIVVREEFVLRLPAGLDPARAAPLLCAGITTYSPLRHWRVSPRDKVAVVGLGGLGHMGVKLANGIGAEVTVVTRSADKAAESRALGAQHVLISNNATAMKAALGRFDFVLDTIPVAHDVEPYLRLLRPQGSMVLVGALDPIPGFHTRWLVGGRRSLAGSLVGGIAETQELLDFCARKDIVAECEITPIQRINEAFVRMEKGDVRYRFVIDMTSLGADDRA